MSVLYATKVYARSEMGRAILEAPQFAHVPEVKVWEALDSRFAELGTKIPIVDEPGAYAPSYRAASVLHCFETTFGTLCPICLCPIVHPAGTLERYSFFADQRNNCNRLIDGWLTLYNNDAIEPCHDDCKYTANIMSILPYDFYAARIVARKRFFDDHKARCIAHGSPRLRFNPRKIGGQKTYEAISMYGVNWLDGDIIFAEKHQS